MDRVEEAATDYKGPLLARPAGEIQEPVFVLGRDGSVLTHSQAAGALIEYTPDYFPDLLHPDDRSPFLKALDAGTPESIIEARLVTTTGPLPFHWSLMDTGNGGILAIARQKDKLSKSAADALIQTELADAFLQAENTVVLVLDGEGRILRFSPGAERLSGLQSQDVFGTAIWETVIAPEQAEDVRRCFQSPPKTRRWERDIDWRTHDGGRRRLSCSVIAVGGDGRKPAYFVASGIDLTECWAAQRQLAEAEERYRRVVELSFELEVTQCDGRIVSMNQRGAEFLGAESPDVFIGRPITSLYAPECRDAVSARVQLAAERWEPAPLAERTMLRLDGSTVTVEAAAIPVKYRGRPATHAVVRNISQRKANERELLRYRERLEELVAQRTTELVAVNRELETFSHSVSHDLRAPLRAINGFVGALLEDHGEQFKGEALRYLDRVAANTERMADIIENLLILSKVIRQPMNQCSVDLADVAHSVIEELRVAEPEREVEFHLDEDMQATGDPALLRVVVQNLLGNAWKYSARENVPRIEFRREEDEQGRSQFCVRDNGVGFDMSHAGDLFGAFNRLHSPSEFEGSGIGLATVKRIVLRHGGEVWAHGSEGEGACFCFRLPQPHPSEPLFQPS